MMPDAPKSLRLVAPELLPALGLFSIPDPTEEPGTARMPQPANGGFVLPQLTPEQASVTCEERYVPGPAGAPDVRILLYTPQGAATDRPAMLHLHGGGMFIGMPEMADGENRDLVLAHGCVIVSVAYRLAPATRWQGSFEDDYAALAWLHAHAGELGIDRGRIVVAGESAGGGHAAALALRARDRGDISIRLLLLDSPMLDDRTGSAAEKDPNAYAGELIWTRAMNRFGWGQLLGQEPGGEDVPEAASPSRAKDLAGMPATFVAVGALDLFFEESLDYVRRLARAGVPVELHVIPGAFHGYTGAGLGAPQVQALMRYRLDALTRAFSR